MITALPVSTHLFQESAAGRRAPSSLGIKSHLLRKAGGTRVGLRCVLCSSPTSQLAATGLEGLAQVSFAFLLGRKPDPILCQRYDLVKLHLCWVHLLFSVHISDSKSPFCHLENPKRGTKFFSPLVGTGSSSSWRDSYLRGI